MEAGQDIKKFLFEVLCGLSMDIEVKVKGEDLIFVDELVYDFA